MIAKSIQGRSTEEIKDLLDANMQDGFRPTLAIVFISSKQDHVPIVQLLNEANISIFGATTNGEFINGDTQTGSIAILLMDINREFFTIINEEYEDMQFRKHANSVASKAMTRFEKPTFMLTYSHIETDAEALLLGIEDVAGPDVTVFGGGAGDDYTFSQQISFSNDFESKKGMVVLVLDENKVKIRGRATCGWKAVGTTRTVTKSNGNHVYTIDGVPVLDLTAKYGGIENVSPDNKNLILEIASNFPLQLQREKGDPVMRPGLLIDWSDHSFYCSGSVPEGSKIRFSLPPDFDVVDQVISNCNIVKDTEMPEADAVIVFSCAGRQIALGPMIQEEMHGVNAVWNVPMIGMFSNAELGRATGGNLEMHNCTTCVIAIKVE